MFYIFTNIISIYILEIFIQKLLNELVLLS